MVTGPITRYAILDGFIRFMILSTVLYTGVCCLLVCFEANLLLPGWALEKKEIAWKNLNGKEFLVPSSDNQTVHGVVLSPSDTTPTGTLVYFHGNGESVADCSPRLQNFCDANKVRVMVFDYPSYGQSTGSPTESRVLEAGRLAVQWLEKHLDQTADQFVFWGRSIGGAVAVPMAAEFKAKALILERTFDSAVSPAKKIYWWVPVDFLMQNRFESYKRIADYNGPLLQSHGNHDRLVPLECGLRLFDAYKNQDKEFVEMNCIGHNDADSSIYKSKLKSFVNRVLGR